MACPQEPMAEMRSDDGSSLRGTQEPSEGGSPPARESGQASWGGISSLMFWRKRRALRIEGAELPAGSRACDGAPSPQQAGTNGLPERRGGEVEASPTPGRAARAGAPETQPACSWEGKRGHRHVRVCGCAYMCQRMGMCVGTCVHMWTGTPVCRMLVCTQMKCAH